MKNGLIFLFIFSFPLICNSQQWERLDVNNPYSLLFHPDSSNIVYVGTISDYSTASYGEILISYDSGTTWDTIASHLSISDIVFHPKDPNIIFFACASNYLGTQPGILKCLKNGSTYIWEWKNEGITLNQETSVLSIRFYPDSPDTMYASTGGFFGGAIWKSVDGGNHWTEIDIPYAWSISILEVDSKRPGIMYYGTSGGCLYKSTDGGESWFPTNSWGERSAYSMKIYPYNSDTLFVCVPREGLFKSPDGGISWVKLDSGITTNNVRSITVDPFHPNNLYLATAIGIYKSSDLGQSWIKYNLNANDDLSDLYLVYLDPESQFLFCGSWTNQLFRLDLNALNVDDNIQVNKNFSLLFNYPNPFNNSTTIVFSTKKSTNVKIEIISMLEESVKTILDEYRHQGIYQIQWDGTNNTRNKISTGLYILTLKTPFLCQSHKLIIIQ